MADKTTREPLLPQAGPQDLPTTEESLLPQSDETVPHSYPSATLSPQPEVQPDLQIGCPVGEPTPAAPAPPAAPIAETMERTTVCAITVPPGALTGQTLEVGLSQGGSFLVTVPSGVAEGQTFYVTPPQHAPTSTRVWTPAHSQQAPVPIAVPMGGAVMHHHQPMNATINTTLVAASASGAAAGYSAGHSAGVSEGRRAATASRVSVMNKVTPVCAFCW